MTRKEMCIFNEIFFLYDKIKSEETLEKLYKGMSLAAAARFHVNEMLLLQTLEHAGDEAKHPFREKCLSELRERCFDRIDLSDDKEEEESESGKEKEEQTTE